MKTLIKPFKKVWQFILFNLMVGFFSNFYFVEAPFQSFITFIIGAIWGWAIFITQWLGHAYIQQQISKKVTWLNTPFLKILLVFISVVLYSYFAFVVVQSLMTFLVLGNLPAWESFLSIRVWGFPITISFIVSLVLIATDFFKNWKTSLLEKEALKLKMLSYRYEALRNQVNPHFMFNSLNVLVHLVEYNQKRAVEFIHQFSQLYRYVLESRDKELVPLKEEISFAKKYIYLLQTRFEEKLKVNLKINIEAKVWIVPMTLQMLIENAVKHNQLSKKNPLVIDIVQTEHQITVSNPINYKAAFKNSNKIGLKNLKEQFLQFSEQTVEIETKNNCFCVQLPLIKTTN